MAIKVLGVCGSMREGSYSTRAVKVALDIAKEYGAETQILDLREVDLPMYKSPSSIGSEQVSQTAKMTEWADVILLSCFHYRRDPSQH